MDKPQMSENQYKLMLAAIDLMAEKGYHGVSTKELAAAAGVSEMTLFRNFGSKLNLLERAVEHFHYGVEMARLFQEQIVWDLRSDLLMISQVYHELMERNRKMLLIVLKNNELTSVRDKSRKHPRRLLELLTGYFEEMQRKGKMIATDAETQAISFMWMNYGAFVSNMSDASPVSSVSMDKFIASSTELFARALEANEA